MFLKYTVIQEHCHIHINTGFLFCWIYLMIVMMLKSAESSLKLIMQIVRKQSTYGIITSTTQGCVLQRSLFRQLHHFGD